MSAKLVFAFFSLASALRINTIEDSGLLTMSEMEQDAYESDKNLAYGMTAMAEEYRKNLKPEMESFLNSGIQDLVNVVVSDAHVMSTAKQCKIVNDQESSSLIQKALSSGKFPEGDKLIPTGLADPDIQELTSAVRAVFLQNPDKVEKVQNKMFEMSERTSDNQLSANKPKGIFDVFPTDSFPLLKKWFSKAAGTDDDTGLVLFILLSIGFVFNEPALTPLVIIMLVLFLVLGYGTATTTAR